MKSAGLVLISTADSRRSTSWSRAMEEFPATEEPSPQPAHLTHQRRGSPLAFLIFGNPFVRSAESVGGAGSEFDVVERGLGSGISGSRDHAAELIRAT